MTETLATFGHHPEPDMDFGIEVDALTGMAYDVACRLQSQWPFWGRLSRAFRVAKRNDWFGRPELEAPLRLLEPVALGNRPLTDLTSPTVLTDPSHA